METSELWEVAIKTQSWEGKFFTKFSKEEISITELLVFFISNDWALKHGIITFDSCSGITCSW